MTDPKALERATAIVRAALNTVWAEYEDAESLLARHKAASGRSCMCVHCLRLRRELAEAQIIR